MFCSSTWQCDPRYLSLKLLLLYLSQTCLQICLPLHLLFNWIPFREGIVLFYSVWLCDPHHCQWSCDEVFILVSGSSKGSCVFLCNPFLESDLLAPFHCGAHLHSGFILSIGRERMSPSSMDQCFPWAVFELTQIYQHCAFAKTRVVFMVDTW